MALSIDERVGAAANSKRLREVNSYLIFGGYLALAFAFFGRGLIEGFTAKQFGFSNDPKLLDWMFVWWPRAIEHHINPFLTRAFWTPEGFNLTWTTSVPLLAIIATPITKTFGPIASLNALCLLSVALAAYSGFLLCRYLTGDWRAALMGGFIFGFSPYMLGSLSFGRLHLLSVWPVPLVVLASVKRWRSELSALAYGAIVAALLAIEFYCSLEIAGTMTTFGGLALLLAWSCGVDGGTKAFLRVALPAGVGFMCGLAAASPLVYYFFFGPHAINGVIWPESMVAGDFLNLFVPTIANELGKIPALMKISRHFNHGLLAEALIWIPLPLLPIAFLYVRRHWREQAGRYLFDLLVIIVVLSLGPILMVGGHETTIGLPGAILSVTPLANSGPARLSLYVFLLLAIMASRWLVESMAPTRTKAWSMAAVAIFMTPNLSASNWARPVFLPRFYRDGVYRSYLKRGETDLILPVMYRDETMLAQAQAAMYFNLADGFGPWPQYVEAWPILDGLALETWTPEGPWQFSAFLENERVRHILIDDRLMPYWKPIVSRMCASSEDVAGVTIVSPNPQWTPAPLPPMLEMRERFDEIRVYRLVIAIENYLSRSGDPLRLNAIDAVKLGLIPAGEVVGPPFATPLADRYHFGIRGFSQNKIEIQFLAYSADADGIIARLRAVARTADFYLERPVTGHPAVGKLTLIFDRAGLGRAAIISQQALRELPPLPAECSDAGTKTLPASSTRG
jgi:hypothetical protein